MTSFQLVRYPQPPALSDCQIETLIWHIVGTVPTSPIGVYNILTVTWPMSPGPREEESVEAGSELVRHFLQGHEAPGACGTLHLKVVPVVVVVALEYLNDDEVHWFEKGGRVREVEFLRWFKILLCFTDQVYFCMMKFLRIGQ